MTIINLVEKLRTGDQHIVKNEYTNGGFAVIGDHYNKMIRMMIDSEDENSEVKDFDTFNSYYYNLEGVIWGLYAAYYISENQRNDLIDELHEIRNRFFEIEEE